MRLPRIHLPRSVWLFIAGMFVGSFFTLKFTPRNAPNPLPPPQGGVLGESVVEERDVQEPQNSEEAVAGAVLFAAGTRAVESKEKIVRVIDGDTVELEGGARLRYIGIDAPEMSSTGREECLAEAAKAANASLVEGKEVEFKVDVSDKDRFGRSLRYVYAGEVFVNMALIEQGLARTYAYPPDTKYRRDFADAEARAKLARLGMWGSVCGTAPADEASPDAGVLPGTCEIKGNISTVGDKIYHLPLCRSYSKTVISTQDGERWFCSEQEAQDAGWRRAKDC
jgi:micrococcal nuclease